MAYWVTVLTKSYDTLVREFLSLLISEPWHTIRNCQYSQGVPIITKSHDRLTRKYNYSQAVPVISKSHDTLGLISKYKYTQEVPVITNSRDTLISTHRESLSSVRAMTDWSSLHRSSVVSSSRWRSARCCSRAELNFTRSSPTCSCRLCIAAWTAVYVASAKCGEMERPRRTGDTDLERGDLLGETDLPRRRLDESPTTTISSIPSQSATTYTQQYIATGLKCNKEIVSVTNHDGHKPLRPKT